MRRIAHGNHLVGTIPDLSKLVSLSFISLGISKFGEYGMNAFSGTVPAWLSKLTALSYMWVCNSAYVFHCRHPDVLVPFTRASSDLGNNMMTGDLSALESLSNLSDV